MEENKYSLLSLNRELTALDAAMAEKTKEYEAYSKQYAVDRANILSNINLAKHSVDAEKFAHGLEILRLEFPGTRTYTYATNTYGPMRYTAIYDTLINDAKRDLANGALRLKKTYFGQKRYDGYDQREDHEYGMWPRHGTIYQSIGLVKPREDLSDYDLECALYVLENIDVQLENLNLSTKE